MATLSPLDSVTRNVLIRPVTEEVRVLLVQGHMARTQALCWPQEGRPRTPSCADCPALPQQPQPPASRWF